MRINQRMTKNNLIGALRRQGYAKSIVDAFNEVPRENFVPTVSKEVAYEDTALPIGQGQTISQPSTIAFMLELLDVRNGQKILEIGSGSGYVLALLSKMNPNGYIFGTERINELVKLSRKKLQDYENIEILHTPEELGFKESSPFDRILVSASAPEIPQEIVEQLKTGGKLVIPVKESIKKLEKTNKTNKIEEYEGFIFVPLVKH